MKKWMKSTVACAVVASTAVGLTGCGLFGSNKSKEGYVFKGYDDTYFVNDTFSVEGTKLRITDKKGKTTEVSVTENMITDMPDMTTAGTKTVTVMYNGVSYSFNITIENRTNEQLLTKLRSFLNRYESNKDSVIDASVNTNLQAKYMNDTADIDRDEAISLLSEMFDKDKLQDAVYNALFDAIVKSSFNLDESYIVSSNELKANLDTEKVLNEIKDKLMSFDISGYLLDLVLPNTTDYYIQKITDTICYYSEIESTSGKLAISKVISTNFDKLKRVKDFNYMSLYNELLVAINEHTTSIVVKDAVSTLNTGDTEAVSHIFSSIVENQWLNNCYVIKTDSYNKYINGEIEEPWSVVSDVADNLIKKRKDADKSFIYSIENCVKELQECETADDFKGVALNYLDAYATYADEMVNVLTTQKNNGFLFVVKSHGVYSSVTNGAKVEEYNQNNEMIYKFVPSYDDDIDYYFNANKDCKNYSNDINTLGLVKTLEKYSLAEKLLEKFNYPEEDKQNAVNKIYSILNSELTGNDLYFAIADILVPNSANEYIAVVKDFVQSYLNNGIVSAIEDSALIEKLIDATGVFSDKKQQLSNVIYKALKGESTGRQLYLDFVNVLITEQDSYYIDPICDFINANLSIDSVSGKNEIKSFITNYFGKLKTATEFDVESALKELFSKINLYTTDEVVKTATSDLQNLDVEAMKHLLSDMVYTQQLETIKVASYTVDAYGEEYYTNLTSQEALDLLDRFANNSKNYVTAYENVVISLLSGPVARDLFDISRTYFETLKNFKSEEAEILKVLQQKQWILGVAVDEVTSTDWLNEYYTPQKNIEYNENDNTFTFNGLDYDMQLDTVQREKNSFVDMYNAVGLIESLIYNTFETIDDLLSTNKQEIINTAMEICYNYLNVERDSYLASDLESLFSGAIDDYLNNTFDKEKFLTDVANVIDLYGSTETKTTLNVGYILYNVLNYDETVDYNEVFKDVKLPKQIENIDYNKFMSQIVTKDTYQIINFENVEIEYHQDKDGKIFEEKLTLKINVNFDTVIASLKGDIVLSMTLDFSSQK